MTNYLVSQHLVFTEHMNRKAVPINITRQLWGQCGSFCQNPECNRPLFRLVADDIVSIANVAHIIGHGSTGPRTDHELAQHIEKDGIDNLIMLCLDCHKVIDELEKKFSVEQITNWKVEHSRRIAALFSVPNIRDEKQLLAEINDLLDQNGAIFREYGPYSENVLNGPGGDGIRIWRRRCLDTILPNNQRIVNLIEKNKRNFSYPWDVYNQMLEYQVHVDAFQDNCLTNQKVNDYKLFPRSFDHFIKTKLGVPSEAPERVEQEEIEFRRNQVRTLIERFLSTHKNIEKLEELNRGTMIVHLKDGRAIKVFVTNTYYFTDYTLDRVLEVDPAVDAIICSSPAGQYAESAKRQCIESGIGLFMLGEFMGAIHQDGERYLNFLLRADRESRVDGLTRIATEVAVPIGVQVFAFGSFLRQKIYGDVDLLVVYKEPSSQNMLAKFVDRFTGAVQKRFGEPDINVCSSREFGELRLNHNNLTKIFP